MDKDKELRKLIPDEGLILNYFSKPERCIT